MKDQKFTNMKPPPDASRSSHEDIVKEKINELEVERKLLHEDLDALSRQESMITGKIIDVGIKIDLLNGKKNCSTCAEIVTGHLCRECHHYDPKTMQYGYPKWHPRFDVLKEIM